MLLAVVQERPEANDLAKAPLCRSALRGHVGIERCTPASRGEHPLVHAPEEGGERVCRVTKEPVILTQAIGRTTPCQRPSTANVMQDREDTRPAENGPVMTRTVDGAKWIRLNTCHVLESQMM